MAHLPAAAHNTSTGSIYTSNADEGPVFRLSGPPAHCCALPRRRELLPMQVRATCRRGRTSAAYAPALGRLTLHAACRRHLAYIRMNSGSASSQSNAPHQRGRAASRQVAAARMAAADDDADEAAASDAGVHAAEAQDIFSARLSALHAFVAQHGQLPLQRERFAGIALGKWVSTQRTLYKQGTLKPERAAALEAVLGWAWNKKEGWASRLSRLQVSSGHPLAYPVTGGGCIDVASVCVVWLPAVWHSDFSRRICTSGC